MTKSHTSLNDTQSDNVAFTLYCVTDALATTVQSNAINPVGIHGMPGQSITVQVTGSAVIQGTNLVILDETGYGRVDIADAVVETVTVTAVSAGYQKNEQMSFVGDYSLTTDGSNNRYQLTKNAPTDGKTPNMIYCANQNGYRISLSGNAYFANGTNHYYSWDTIELAAEVFDQYPETALLFESTGVTVGDIIFLPVV